MDRRRFLASALTATAAAGSLGMLSGCTLPQSTPTPAAETLPRFGTPERPLVLGFVPIACTSGILAADALGHFAAVGLSVRLQKFAGWAELWGAYVAGEIDAAHMLAPMPLALHHGLAAGQTPTTQLLQANTNGQGLMIATALDAELGGAGVQSPEDLKGTILGIPFDYSMHNLLLREYLAHGGVHPDAEVELRLMRPADMVAGLQTGLIDGYFGPEPFLHRSVANGSGRLLIASKDIYPDHPCCAVAMRSDFAAANPEAYQQLTAAIGDSLMAAHPAGAHRHEIAHAVAQEKYLNQPEAMIQLALSEPDGINFQGLPEPTPAAWMLTQFVRWGYLDGALTSSPDTLHRAVTEVLDLETAAAHYAARGQDTQTRGIDHISGRAFDPTNADTWTLA